MDIYARDLVPYRDWIVVGGHDAVVLSNVRNGDRDGILRVWVFGDQETSLARKFTYRSNDVVALVATGTGYYATAS